VTQLSKPTLDEIKAWLMALGHDYSLCDHCHGLHLSALQNDDLLMDGRLFVEEDGLLLTSEVEVRPADILRLNAELPEINMRYPALKCFIDLQDDVLPRLIICDVLMTGAGTSRELVDHFLRSVVEATLMLVRECAQAGWVYPDGDAEGDSAMTSDAVH